MLILALLLQAAPADIELRIGLRARSVEIERKGEAKLEVRAQPDAGSRARVRTDPPAQGRTSLRNVRVEVDAQARIGEPPAETASPAETPRPD